MSKSNNQFTLIIPAAGIGSRSGLKYPKQYFKVHQQTVIEHSIETFSSHPDLKQIVVVLAEGDDHWYTLSARGFNNIKVVTGGEKRFQSVLNGLRLLEDYVEVNDWIMVHDAVRPCVRFEDIDRLWQTCKEGDGGGILAVPVRDTVKQGTPDKVVEKTIERENLWLAQTPQLFRYAVLKKCLLAACGSGADVTDEASAVEKFSDTPITIVPGSHDNIKLTYPEDLELARYYLRSRQE